MLIQRMSFSWQVLQLPETPAWIIAEVGAGAIKLLPGNVRGVVTDNKPLGLLPAWQDSQVAVVGIWELGPCVALLGIATICVTP
jgi:hypothetical protein